MRVGPAHLLKLLLAFIVGISVLSGAPPVAAVERANAEAADARVLVFSKTAGERHESIAAGVAAITALGAGNGFEVVATEDAGAFTAANLATFDAVVFLSTTGDVLNAEQQAAFEAYIGSGGGFAGVHSAADTEYDWAFYGDLVGAYRQSAPAVQQATVVVPDRVHPSTEGLPLEWTRTDEWYNFRSNPESRVHVLANLQEKSYTPGSGAMGYSHPISWCQVYDGGRSWFTGMGHTAESYADESFTAHLLGGIQYAAGLLPGDCGATIPSNYETSVLTHEVNEPVTLDIAPDGRVFFNSRGGQFRVYDPESQNVTQIQGVPPVFSGLEDGLIGVAIDPDFATNNWIYLHYSPVGIDARRVSRFTLTGGDTLTDEKQMIEWFTQRQVCCHTGGDMAWDSQGNLYFSTGDNTNSMQSSGMTPTDERPGRSAFDAQRTSGNTNDLNGKIVRITPQDDGTYTIPEGNLFPESEDPGDKTRPEIYVMGVRNPYRIWVDPETDWLYWGNVGPDAAGPDPNRGPASYDEWDMAKEPGNYGWPYCSGDNEAYNDYNFATNTSGPKYDCQNLVNDSPNNTGLTELPPAIGADIWYRRNQQSQEFPWIPDGGGNTAMGGPVYRYDESVENETKFPEYWDGKWFIFEWARDFQRVLTMDNETESPVYAEDFAPMNEMVRPFDMEFGPDGAAYVLDYGTGYFSGSPEAALYKVEYTGGKATPVPLITADGESGAAPLTVQFSSEGTQDPQGSQVTYAWDFDNDGTVDSTEANPTYTYTQTGQFDARLTVVDPEGNDGTITKQITVGNTAPTLTIDAPLEGGFFDFGDGLAYTVTVTDPEDGDIDCSKVVVSYVLGHAQHGHPQNSTTGCEGVLETGEPGDGHGLDANVFGVVAATYTDEGGAGGVPALTVNETVSLQTKHKQAEFFTDWGRIGGTTTPARIGTGSSEGGVRIGDIHNGEWTSYDPVNFSNITAMRFGVSSGGAGGMIELRIDAPDGPLVGSVEVANTGSYEDYAVVEAPVTDPGGTHELFLVYTNPDTEGALFDVDYFEAVGKGVSANARPEVVASASSTVGPVPFNASFTAEATDPEGGALTYSWDFGDGSTSTEQNPGHTYTSAGFFTVTVTVTDPGGANDTSSIEVQAFATAESCLRDEGSFCVLDLEGLYNQDGISTHDNPGDGNFDGGGWSFASEVVPAAGAITSGGVPFEFPDSADGLENNAEARGQVIPLYRGNFGKVHILASTHNGDVEADATVTYADGTTSQLPLRFTDWAQTPHFGETVAVASPHRHSSSGDTGPAVRIFTQEVALDPDREVLYLTLPDADRLHVFGVTLDRGVLVPVMDLQPATGNPYIGDGHSLTTSVTTGGVGNADQQVTFEVYRKNTEGAYAFLQRSTATTAANGSATLDYNSDAAAEDVVVSCTGTADCIDGDTVVVQDGQAQNVSADADLVDTAMVTWSQQPELEEGYIALFDGSQASFENWSQAGPGSFVLEDGVISSQGGLGLFWYDEQEFANYNLRLQFRTEEPTDNSGVFIRFPNPGNDPGVAINNGYEVQIYDGETGEPQKTGSIYNFDRENARNSNPSGQWNDYEIEVVGRTITVTLNGEVVNTYTGDASRALQGFIGLQNHGNADEVSFRNIRIRELPDTEPEPEPGTGVFDEIGITGPQNVASGQIQGGYSFAAELMPAAGTVVTPETDATDDVPFLMPDTSGEAANLAAASGQTFTLTGEDRQAYSTLHVFGAATDAGQGAAMGTFRLTFADGSTRDVEVALQDWGYPGSGDAGSHVAIGPMEYRHNSSGNDNAPVPFYFYHAALPVSSDQPLVSVTLPTDISTTDGNDHPNAELYTMALTFETASGGFVTPDLAAAAPMECPDVVETDDEFTGDTLDKCRWSDILREDVDGYRVGDGVLEIDTLSGEVNTAPNLILQPAPTAPYDATTKLSFSTPSNGHQAGVVVHEDSDNFAKVVLVNKGGGNSWIEMVRVVDGSYQLSGSFNTGNLPADFPETFWLRLSVADGMVVGFYSTDGETWIQVGDPRTAAGLEDASVGVMALRGPSNAAPDTATFDWFHLDAVVEQPADTTAPTATATLAGDVNGDGDYTGPVTVTITGADEEGGSGLESVEYAVDDGAWTAYSEPVRVEGAGEHSVKFRATDEAGNVSEEGTVEFTIAGAVTDTTAPVIELGGIRDGEGYGDSEIVTLSFSASDGDGSGVASLTATLDGEPIESGDSLGMPWLGLGEHTVVVTATDNEGNTAEESVTFMVRTSFADIGAIMDSLVEQDRLSARVAASLQDRLDRAEREAATDSEDRPLNYLRQFVARAKNQVKGDAQDVEVRDLLVRDAEALIAQFEVLAAAEDGGEARLSNGEIGVQLYTVRDAVRDQGLDPTLAAVAAAGYQNVELAGTYGLSAADFAEKLESYGLHAVSSHIGIGGDFAATLADAETLGQSMLGVAYHDEDSIEGWEEFARDLDEAGAAAREAGLTFFYHNHAHEFAPIDGVRPYDVLLANTDPENVKFELDVYWAIAGDADPVQLMDEHPGRFVALHVKDMAAEGGFADVGEGVIDFAPIFAAARRNGVEAYFVENDAPIGNPTDSVVDSYLNLRQITFPSPAGN